MTDPDVYVRIVHSAFLHLKSIALVLPPVINAEEESRPHELGTEGLLRASHE